MQLQDQASSFSVKVHMALSKITARDQDFEDSVRMHFTRGVAELASVASCLLRKEDPSVYAEVREHIKKASQEFSHAEDLAQEKLERVDSATLDMMAQKKKLKDEQKVLNENLSTLQTHLRSSKIRQWETTRNCQAERLEKHSAQLNQARAEAEAETERSTRNVALWSMLIPVVGTVAGGVVAIVAHRAMKNAEQSATLSKELVEECTEREQEYCKEAEKYVQLIYEYEESILKNQRRIKAIEEEEDTLAKLHKEVLDLQEALRHCSHFVGTLASRASAAEITSRYVCIYDSLRDQLNDMCNQIFPVLGVHSIGAEGMSVLSSPTVERTIRKLKRLSRPPNISLNIYYDRMDHLRYGETFSWHFILYGPVLLFLAVFYFGSFLVCLAEKLLLQLVLTVVAVFSFVLRLFWLSIICFIVLYIFTH